MCPREGQNPWKKKFRKISVDSRDDQVKFLLQLVFCVHCTSSFLFVLVVIFWENVDLGLIQAVALS